MRMNRAGRLDVEREPRPPGALGRFDLVAAPVTRNLELRHGRALRRHKRNFEIPARHGRIEPRCRRVGLARQRGDLQQRLPRDGASVSSSRCRALVASGAPGAIDGEATGCADGNAPRNGGGGVLVWTVTSSLRPSFGIANASEGLPISRRHLLASFLQVSWRASLQHFLKQIERSTGRRRVRAGVQQCRRRHDLRQKNFLRLDFGRQRWRRRCWRRRGMRHGGLIRGGGIGCRWHG